MKYTLYHTHRNAKVGQDQPLLVEVEGCKEKCPDCQNRKVATMPIKVIAASELPARVRERGSPITEIRETLEAVKTLKATQAIQVDLSEETRKRYSQTKEGKARNPAAQLVIALARTFAAKELPYAAYSQNGLVFVKKKEHKK